MRLPWWMRAEGRGARRYRRMIGSDLPMAERRARALARRDLAPKMIVRVHPDGTFTRGES